MRKINISDFRVATNMTPRHVNRRIILNLLRAEQPISRAELARRTGLQRSTISLIIDQLIAENWITETISDGDSRGNRGRRPIQLCLNANRGRIIGIDIRPTITTLGLSDFAGHFFVQETFTTVSDPDAFIEEICRRTRSFVERECSGGVCAGIGVSVPGRVDLATRHLAFAPNLSWRDIDIKSPLESVTGLPVEIDNEANACALEELYFQVHAENMEHLIAVSVTEGIGTGIIIGGQLLLGPSGLAGEFGHSTIEPDGLPCRCGNRGCWEMYCSTLAGVRYFKEFRDAAKKKANGTPARANGSHLRLAGDHSRGNITFNDLLGLSESGDICATQAIERMATYLGIGLANLVNGFTPSMIVIFGEVTRAWTRIAPILEQTIATRAVKSAATRVLPANEMLQPRLRGAIALVLHRHFGVSLLA